MVQLCKVSFPVYLILFILEVCSCFRIASFRMDKVESLSDSPSVSSSLTITLSCEQTMNNETSIKFKESYKIYCNATCNLENDNSSNVCMEFRHKNCIYNFSESHIYVCCSSSDNCFHNVSLYDESRGIDGECVFSGYRIDNRLIWSQNYSSDGNDADLSVYCGSTSFILKWENMTYFNLEIAQDTNLNEGQNISTAPILKYKSIYKENDTEIKRLFEVFDVLLMDCTKETEKNKLKFRNCESENDTRRDICEVCNDGWYGESCEKKCSNNCFDEICDKTTGKCTLCKFGWFGDKCNQKCLDNCMACFENTTCLICADGFFGHTCNETCPVGCTRCSKDGRICTKCGVFNNFGDDCKCTINECKHFGPKLKCMECKQSGWYTSSYGCCPCSEQCYNGQENCNMTFGVCEQGCQNGFFGNHCDLKCSPYCNGNCDQTTGTCTEGCIDGWYMDTCSYECSLFYPYCAECADTTISNLSNECIRCEDGYFMPSKFTTFSEDFIPLNDFCHPCDHCLKNSCNGSSGLCIEGCKHKGRYNSEHYIDGEKYCVLECPTCYNKNCDHLDGTCLEGCIGGYHGSHCSLECSKFCPNNTCGMETGYCWYCNTGQYGPYCNNSCGHCKGVICHQHTGVCQDGCLQGYYELTCTKHCSSCVGTTCEINGSCIHGCVPGYYGKICNLTCGDGCRICHPVSGYCIVPNTTGINISYSISNDACAYGKYGITCEVDCGFGCKKRGKEVICDKFTGFCNDCLDGYYGLTCNERCNQTCIDLLCDREGRCTRGCTFRWQGKYCQNYYPETVFEQISGILFGVMCMVVLVVCVLCVMRKKRNLKKTFSQRDENVALHMSKDRITYV